MHSMMEGEGGSEPQDVFVELGTLIVEGRVPGGGNARGYSEGPHCGSGLGSAPHRHSCNSQQNFLCKRAENFRKHMLLLFHNNVPMCIEVVLCADCSCGAQKCQSAEVGIVPSSCDLLLEQWTITAVNRNNELVPMLAKGLVQAVRSQLHFSQLSAWWSSSKGSRPNHVSYRVTVPGQAFSSQFSRQPNEHTFPLAAVGKSSAIQVCVRSLPRMELVPFVPCPVHNESATTTTSVKEAAFGVTLAIGETAPVSAGGSSSSSLEVVGDPSLGASLLDPPQRFRSPPRAAEAPHHDHMVFRRLPAEVGARWQPPDNPPSPPLPGWLRRRDGACPGIVCPQAAASKSWQEPEKSCGLSGLLDDRMQMECNMPGKHHCSCEGEEDVGATQDPGPVRQRRRSQVSLPSPTVQTLPPTSSSTATLSELSPTATNSLTDDSPRRVVNESTKRSSGLAVMGDEYLYSSESGAGSGSGNSTGSLKRRRPVVESVDTGSSCFEKERSSSTSNLRKTGATASSSLGAVGGVANNEVSSVKGSTAPIQLKPPLSRREMEEVLAVLRDRNKPHVRPTPQTQQVHVWCATLTESSSKLKDLMGQSSKMSDACVPLFRLSPPTETAKKSTKGGDLYMDAMWRSLSSSRHSARHCWKHDGEDFARTKQCEKLESNCDKKWSDIKCVNCCSGSKNCSGDNSTVDSRTNGGKPSSDLIEDRNNQDVCDNHTSVHNRDIRGKYLCLSHVSQTSQTKEGNQWQFLNKTREESSSTLCTPPSPHPLRSRSRRDDCSNEPLSVKCVTQEAQKDLHQNHASRQLVPSASERARFRRSFDNAASMVFHTRTGLPLTSSPAPVRRGTTRFDYDSSLNSVSAIRCALFDTPLNGIQIDDALNMSSDETESEGGARSPCSPDAGIAFPVLGPYHALAPCSSLLGSFEESVLNGRLEPVSTVQGFTAELGASGSYCPRHLKLPVTVFFYTLGDYDKVSTPYLGHINLGKKGYNVPRSGTIQVTLFNPMGTVIKMFVVMYDLTDMPPNSHTFLRQRTLYMPAGTEVAEDIPDSELTQKFLRYLIHLRFSSSKSGRIYLHTDIRMIIFRKSDMDTATAHKNNNLDTGFELRSFTHGPGNPKFSPR